jgi:large subunit ribosomal protein L22
MEVTAKSTFIRQTPRKMRLVADLVRGLSVENALAILKHTRKRAAKPFLLTLKQGIGNATNNFGLKKESLIVKKLVIGKGPSFKRGRAVSRGRWHPILKKTSHITMVLEGKKEEKTKKKPKGGKSGSKN